MLEMGTKAPAFTLPDQNGEMRSLADYRGQKVILYFYPKDMTAGCTKQACAFGDLYPHVPGPVTKEELQFEREEFARRKEAKLEKAAKKKKIPLNEYKAQLKEKERKKAAAQRKRKAFFRALPERFAALVPAKRKNAGYTHGTQEVPEREEKENASRRRRGRQE